MKTRTKILNKAAANIAAWLPRYVKSKMRQINEIAKRQPQFRDELENERLKCAKLLARWIGVKCLSENGVRSAIKSLEAKASDGRLSLKERRTHKSALEKILLQPVKSINLRQ